MQAMNTQDFGFASILINVPGGEGSEAERARRIRLYQKANRLIEQFGVPRRLDQFLEKLDSLKYEHEKQKLLSVAVTIFRLANGISVDLGRNPVRVLSEDVSNTLPE